MNLRSEGVRSLNIVLEVARGLVVPVGGCFVLFGEGVVARVDTGGFL